MDSDTARRVHTISEESIDWVDEPFLDQLAREGINTSTIYVATAQLQCNYANLSWYITQFWRLSQDTEDQKVADRCTFVIGQANWRHLCNWQSARIPSSHMNCSATLGSNQVLRAPTPLTKDVSRVYPPISLSSSLSLLLFTSLLGALVAVLFFLVALLLSVGCLGRVVPLLPFLVLSPSPVFTWFTPFFEFVWCPALSDFHYPLPCAPLPASVSIVLRSGPVLSFLDCPISLPHCPDSLPPPSPFCSITSDCGTPEAMKPWTVERVVLREGRPEGKERQHS